MKEKNITSQETVEQVNDIQESKLYYIAKHVIDFIAGIFGVILLLPIAGIVKICYICQHDFHSVFFKQERIGKNGKPIYIYKLRSMIPNADQVLFDLLEKNEDMRLEYKQYKKLRNDPRITKVGKIIRDNSIDEVPQFLNLLKGDMSLVGPRPYLFREKEDMGEYYDTIIKCKPGITGYWQVSGRSNVEFAKRLVLDEYYYYHRNLGFDARIIAKTFAQVIMKKEEIRKKILIKDIFADEIMRIGSQVYVEMQGQNEKRVKDAIRAWDILETLSNKPITDSGALNKMIHLTYRLQYAPVYVQPVDEEKIAVRIKQYK